MTESVGAVNTNIFQDPQPVAETPNKELGQDEFLHLLTAQLKAQNPLEPANNQEFVAQLAQFSQLEQLTNMNTALEQQIETNVLLSQSMTNVSATNLIGRSVKSSSPTLNVEGGSPVQLGYNLFAAASDLRVEIRDRSGTVVRSLNPTARSQGDNTVSWDAKDDHGSVVRDGDYFFTVTALDKNGVELETLPFTTGKVNSVRFLGGGTVLVVDGRDVPLGDILSVLE